MKKMVGLAFMGTMMFGLAACNSTVAGGGGGAGGGGTPPSGFEDAFALYDAVENGELDSVDTSSRSGSATMTGALGFEDVGEGDEELSVVGDLTLVANFDTDTLSGNATGFGVYDSETGALVENGEVTGSLTVSNGTISGADMSADLTGTMVNDGDDFVFDYTMDGGIYDNSGDLAAVGDLNGTINGDGFDGGFAVSE